VRRLGLVLGTVAVLAVVLLSVWIISRPERGTTGAVSTKFRLLGPNDKIVIDGFDDPKVDGVACHISRAQTGGMKGAFGVAEDTSDASIACRQVGPIKIKGEIEDGERVFDERRTNCGRSCPHSVERSGHPPAIRSACHDCSVYGGGC
jgi:CreA protein